MNTIWLERRKAAQSEHDVLDRGVITEHRDEDLAAACIGDLLGDLRALRGQCLRLAACAIVDDDAMTGLQQIERYRSAHMAKSDKAYFHEATSLTPATRRLRRVNSVILDGRQLPSN